VADLNPKKVMVIDNDSDTLDSLERHLRERGVQPVIVRRGAQAVKRVKDEKPGAVVMELSLPDQDGRTVIKEIKDDWDVKKVPILVLSNYPNRLDYATREKVEAVFGKPTAFEDLYGELQRAIEKAQKS
jgi:DNA-binding response OmpR family regulator